jgi:hypothetical protein
VVSSVSKKLNITLISIARSYCTKCHLIIRHAAMLNSYLFWYDKLLWFFELPFPGDDMGVFNIN